MIRFLELIFYIMYLSYKNKDKRKNMEKHEVSFVGTALLGLSLMGTLFLNGVFLLFGVVFDIGILKFLVAFPEYGTPLVLVAPLVTGVFFYNFSVRGGKYLEYPQRYPEVTTENLRRYDQNYLMLPVVFSFLFPCFALWATFSTGRGI